MMAGHYQDTDGDFMSYEGQEYNRDSQSTDFTVSIEVLMIKFACSLEF